MQGWPARRNLAYTILPTVVSGGPLPWSGGGGRRLEGPLPPEEFRGPGGGYGALVSPSGVLVGRLSEEHGDPGSGWPGLGPGGGGPDPDHPNHVCVSVNLQDHIVVLDGDRVGEVPVEGRGPSSPDAGRRGPCDPTPCWCFPQIGAK